MLQPWEDAWEDAWKNAWEDATREQSIHIAKSLLQIGKLEIAEIANATGLTSKEIDYLKTEMQKN